MKLNLYDVNLNRIAIIQEQFVSCFWEEGYNTVGSFSLELQATDEYKSKVKTDYYVGRDDRKTLMVIKSVTVEDNIIIATGKQAARVLDDVAFIGTISENSIIANVLPSAYNNSNKYENVVIASSSLADRYGHQISNKSFLELYEAMCQETDVGFRAIRDTNRHVAIELYKPAQNPNLIFSEDYGNLNGVSITLSTENYKNYAIVLGEDTGDNRKRVDVDLRSDSNEQKRELIVDARDLQNDVQIDLGEESQDLTPMTDEETQRVADEREAEYEKGLTARGVEKLLEQTKTWKCDFLPSADEFGTKYDLGDIMTVYLKKYGIIITARIAKFVQKQQRNQTDTTISVGSLTVRRS